MGMILGLTTLSDGAIERCLADPPLVMCVLAPHDPEAYHVASGQLPPPRARGPKRGLIQRLFGRGPAATEASAVETLPPPPTLELAEGEGEEVDLDKAWQTVHFLLTGSQWEGEAPWSFLLHGGTVVGDVDVGYGPARALRSDEVVAVDRALAGLSVEQFATRFDRDALAENEVYPAIWGENEDVHELAEYVVENYDTLRDFVGRARQRGLGLLISIV